MSQRTKPYIFIETPGIKYYCSCGKTKKRMYCDGSHEGTGKTPYKIEFKKEKKIAICAHGCWKSKKLPFCDGTHLKIQKNTVF